MRASFWVSLFLSAFFIPPGIEGARSPGPSAADPVTTNPYSNELYSKEPYVFELIERNVRFEADGRGQQELTLRVRIQSESAVRGFGLLVYPYASSFETLDVLYVRVRKPGGTILETPSSDVQELDTAVSREAPMYTDQREKHIAVKSLAVGDILEAHLRWTIHDSIAPGHFWFDHSYYRSGICLQETLQLNIPANVAVKLRNSDPQPSVREEGGRRLYMFKSSNLKKQEESRIPEWERNFHGAPLPDVQISSFSSWDEIGKWFDSLEQPKLAITAEIQAKAEELVKGKTSEDEKLHAIYDFVSTRFRYIGIDLGQGRYSPHAASEVLVNRYGDCKDKHTLFAALLRAAGISAYPALISSKYRADPSFPTPSLFDHVITAIPRAESFLFLDTTPEVAPYGLLLRNLRDRKALVIPPALDARLVTTPADPPFLSFERLQIDSSIDANGTLDAKMRLEDRGDSEVLLRLAYHATPQNRWQELTQKIVARLGFGGTVSDVGVAVPEDMTQPFWVTCSYHWTDYPDWKEHRVTIPAPPILLAGLNEEQKLSKDPLPLGTPQDITYETSMKFPEGYSPFITEKKVEKKSDFAEFAATFSFDQGVLHGTLHLKTLLREVPGAERAQLNDLARQMDETARRFIFVSEKKSSATSTTTAASASANKPTKPEVSPAKALFDSAQRASNNRDYAASAQLYEEAVAKDPNYKDAWNSLGWTYNQLRQYEKAEAAFRKALALDPEARFAHNNLGQALAGQKRYEEAIPEYQKEVQINPKDMWAHANLGRVYTLTEQFGKAILELETAATITPNDPAVQFNLGRSYAKTGEPEKAARAFNRSVELEPTASRKNAVAYEMALDRLDLGQAEKFVDSAIEHAIGQARDVSLDHLSNEDAMLPAALSAYWDTLGWVKFQQGKIAEAEKYIRSAWLVRSIGEIGDHLGQIYEKEGRKAEAEQMYSLALATAQPMPEAKPRLVALLGSDADAERMAKEALPNLGESRTIKVKNTHDADGIAEFWILFSPGPRVIGVRFISGDDALRPFTNDLEVASFPDMFPDTTDVKFLRRGKLTCLRSSGACSVLLLSAETVRSAN